jgi:tetratricopeptide (TPR) repeat protein
MGDSVRAQGFAEALRAKGRKVEALEILGDIALAGKRYSEAARAYGEALSAKPGDALALKYHQTRLTAGEQPERVIADARKMLKRHPDFLALKGLVAGLLLQTRPEQARELYRDILERQPRNVAAMNNLAWLNLERNPTRALALSQQAFRLAPKNLDVADTYIRSLDRAGQKKQARQLLERLLEKNPQSRILRQLSETLS